MEDMPQTIVPVQEPYYKKVAPAFLTALLGSGRIISNIALVNQGMQKTFFYVELKAFPYPETLSGMAAFANGTSDSLTRFPAIYKKLTSSDENNDDITQEPEYYSPGLTSIYCFIMTAGVLDMVYFTLNNFSAIIQLECQYLGDEHCKNGFDWPYILPYLPAAVICSLSTGYAFAAYTLPFINGNAISFIDYLDNFSENFIKESKLILAGTSLLACMYSVSLGATLFFSTSKMLFNLLGPAISEYSIIQAQVYISMIASIIGGIFSWIAEGKKLLLGQKAGFSQWFAEDNPMWRKVLAAALFPTLAINVASHALNNFPGNIEILDKVFSGYEKFKMGFALANSLNTAFLYFAFNTGQAISNAVGVKNDIISQNNKSPAKLLAFHGLFNACSQPKKDTLEIVINEKDSLMKSKNEKRCGCTIF